MLLSMTGYGKAEYIFAEHKTTVEIRTLNSKQLDLSLKSASAYHDKELEIRGMLREQLERGKVDVLIAVHPLETTESEQFTPINWQAMNYYVEDYKRHAAELEFSVENVPAEVLSCFLRFPDVMRVSTTDEELSDEEWNLLKNAVSSALMGVHTFREQEGKALQAMFEEKLSAIETLLKEVEPYEKGRVEHIRQHLLDNLDKLADKTKQAIDKNRLEQEMIYYLEKLDITEEKVRLTNHIRYFRECMLNTESGVGKHGEADRPERSVGKKLGFVAQEMGREINTLGSKSNQSEMQIIVVKMKDILEQIKEQVLNVL